MHDSAQKAFIKETDTLVVLQFPNRLKFFNRFIEIECGKVAIVFLVKLPAAAVDNIQSMIYKLPVIFMKFFHVIQLLTSGRLIGDVLNLIYNIVEILVNNLRT